LAGIKGQKALKNAGKNIMALCLLVKRRPNSFGWNLDAESKEKAL